MTDPHANGNVGVPVDVLIKNTNMYLYKNKEVVKENDIVFYSEDIGEGKHHYADCLGVIVKRGDDFKMKAYVITMDEAKTFINYEEPEHNMVSLWFGCDGYPHSPSSNTLRHFTKIGEYPKDARILTAEYANKHYAKILS